MAIPSHAARLQLLGLYCFMAEFFIRAIRVIRGS